MKRFFNRAGQDRSLDFYLSEIAKIPLIGRKEEVSLAKRIHQGDDNALEYLTKANLRFVVSVAKQYQNRGLELADLINEGNIGLIKAAKKFDETYGFKFISYAVWWIRQAILQALEYQNRIVRLPLNRVAKGNLVRKTAVLLQQEHSRSPSDSEIASRLEITEEEVREAVRQFSKDVSLDAPFAQSEENALIDVLEEELVPSPAATLKHRQLREELEKVLNSDSMPEGEAEILYLHFGWDRDGHGFTRQELADHFGISTENARQLVAKAIRRFKGLVNIEQLLILREGAMDSIVRSR